MSFIFTITTMITVSSAWIKWLKFPLQIIGDDNESNNMENFCVVNVIVDICIEF